MGLLDTILDQVGSWGGIAGSGAGLYSGILNDKKGKNDEETKKNKKNAGKWGAIGGGVNALAGTAGLWKSIEDYGGVDSDDKIKNKTAGRASAALGGIGGAASALGGLADVVGGLAQMGGEDYDDFATGAGWVSGIMGTIGGLAGMGQGISDLFNADNDAKKAAGWGNIIGGLAGSVGSVLSTIGNAKGDGAGDVYSKWGNIIGNGGGIAAGLISTISGYFS